MDHGKKQLDFGGDLDSVTLGLVVVRDYGSMAVGLILDRFDCIKGECLTLAEVCTLLSAILV